MPDPCSYSSQDEFVSDCISERQRENPDEEVDQSVAICNQMWRDRDCGGKSQQREAPTGRVEKQGEAFEVGEREAVFVASSTAVDRVGDIVEQNWDLRHFRKNPVFLYQHQHRALPIGKVKRVWTADDKTKTYARVEAPERGLDEFADKVWAFLKAGLLNAVSVGFNPIDDPEPIEDRRGFISGFRFPRNELMELSLVSVPANQEALVVARSMVSEAEIPKFFDVSAPKSVSAGASRQIRHARRYVEINRLRVRG